MTFNEKYEQLLLQIALSKKDAYVFMHEEHGQVGQVDVIRRRAVTDEDGDLVMSIFARGFIEAALNRGLKLVEPEARQNARKKKLLVQYNKEQEHEVETGVEHTERPKVGRKAKA